uniref:Polyadenylate-binding protein n=2 Tax=Kalanchoe fedtschenkoi TaxID=63787 RepID=A0A7N0ZQ73_KALFE
MDQIQPQAPVGGTNGLDGVAVQATVPLLTTPLYVGDLDVNVTDLQLYDLFGQVGQVASVRVCRDLSTGLSLGYGYVNFTSAEDASKAIEELNFTPLHGKTIRVTHSHRDPSVRKSGAGNVYIKNLDKSIDNKALQETFSMFGPIVSCKIPTDASGQSLGYGFVQFENEESAQNAMEKLNGMLINDKQVYVGPFVRKQERESVLNNTKFTNVYVKNLSEAITDEDLDRIFGEYGKLTSSVVMKDADGKSKCFGFVNFQDPDAAARAVEALNGNKIDDKVWFVGKAQKKSEREQELKGRFEQNMKEAADNYQGVNLYVKNLHDSIDDEKLKGLFSEFGTITSCKVTCDPSGISRGSGFVAFTTPEEASRALVEMNGKMVVSKPLYVAIAQKKEERKAKLQAQFSQMRPIAMAPPASPRMPVYPPGAPGLGQQLFYGQAPPAVVSQQGGFGYQQHLMPGMMPGGAPMPNIFMPMAQQGQPAQRPGGRRGAAGLQAQPMHMMQQQMVSSGRLLHRYPPGQNMAEHGMPIRDPLSAVPLRLSALATSLANANPDQQRTLLGESLYPLVDQLEHESAAKVTGMLLEMDQTEVLHLIESPEALMTKVAEAMAVLHSAKQQKNPADQLANLSLN